MKDRFTRIVVAALAVAAPSDALAQQLHAQPFATGVSLPVAFLGDPTAANRHFVVEKTGTIRILVDGVPQSTPFLDLTARISDGPERGLLGMALDPDFAVNRRFYVFFTRRDDPATTCDTSNPANRVGCEEGGIVVARFRRSPTNPLMVEGSSRFDFRWGSPTGPTYIDHSEFGNHNGGTLMFGPDGYLYIGIGDGGGAYDPRNRGQDPNSLLGKILRIDVNVLDSNAQGYQIPADNPFVDNDPITARPEIWAFGMRNPWKYSFDDPARGGTGAMIVADVGQDRWEEINHEPAGMGGRNYGWGIWEGNHGNPNPPTSTPAFTPLIFPVYEYSHVTGETFLQGRSITGGFVYRGSDLSAMWRGRYFFADFASMRIWSAQVTPGTGAFSNIIDHTAAFGSMNVSSFGVDQRGELYIVRYGGVNQGIIYRLCEFTLTPGVTSFSREGGIGTVHVATQPGCAWTASSDQPWLTVLSNAQATGSGMMTFRVDAAALNRTAQLTVAGQAMTVSRSNAPPVHGDIDGNGTADILWQHTDGRMAAWRMNGTSLIQGLFIGPGFLADTDWQIVASGDFDRDGNRDIIFQHQTDGRLAMWRMSGVVLLGGMPLSPAQVVDTNWKIRAAIDISGDGWLDLLWQHEGNGSVAVWEMVGTQLRAGYPLAEGVVPDLNWKIVGALPAPWTFTTQNHIFWQHQTSGMIGVWVMDRHVRVAGRQLHPSPVTDTNWKIRAVTSIAAAQALVWQNQATGLLSVWRLDDFGDLRVGEGLRLVPPEVSDTNWKIVGPK